MNRRAILGISLAVLAVTALAGAAAVPDDTAWEGNTSSEINVSFYPGGSVTPEFQDQFDTDDTATWSQDSLASYDSQTESAVLLDVTSETGTAAGEYLYDPGGSNEDIYVRAEVTMEGPNQDYAFRYWLMADYANPSSIPSSDNGYRIEYTRGGTDNINVYDRSGGSWTQLASQDTSLGENFTLALFYDASADTLTVYSVEAGEHLQQVEVTGVSGKSHSNLYLTGYIGSNTDDARIEADNVVVRRGTFQGSVTSATQSPSDTDVQEVGVTHGAAWNDWEIQNATVLNSVDGDVHADPALVVEPDRTYPYHMLARDGDEGSVDLWRSQDGETWELQEENAAPALVNTLIEIDGTYYGYYQDAGNGVGVISADSLNGSWTDHGVVWSGFYDPGVYYSEESGTAHLFAEGTQVADDPGSNQIHHGVASSPTGSFTDQGAVVNLSDSTYRTGDPELIRVGDTIHMFADRDQDHPRYGIVHYTADDINASEYTRGDTFALTPNASTRASYGTGDLTVRYYNGQFYGYFENWDADNQDWRIGYATSDGPWEGGVDARAHLDTTDDGTLDTTTAWETVDESYEMGTRDRNVSIANAASIDVSSHDPVYRYQVELNMQVQNTAFRNDPSSGGFYATTSDLSSASGTVTDRSGSAIGGATVEIYNSGGVGGTVVASNTTASDGSWSVSGLSDDDYVAQASASGYHTNETAFTVSGSDVTGVGVTLAAVSAPSASNLDPSGGETLRSESVTLSATVEDADFAHEDGDTVTAEFFVDGSSVGTDTLAANGTASTSTTLADGSYSWHVELSDNYGETTTSATESFEVAHYPPRIDSGAASPSGGETVTTATPTLSVPINDSDFAIDGDTVDVAFSVDGSEIHFAQLTSNGTVDYTTNSLADGDHTWSVTVNDSYGNSVSDSWTFTVDTSGDSTTDGGDTDGGSTGSTSDGCTPGKGFGEYIADLQFFEAVPCTLASAPMIGGLGLLGLLVFGAIAGHIYARTGSVMIPFALTILTGGALLPFVAPPGVALAALVIVLVGGGVFAYAYHTWSR